MDKKAALNLGISTIVVLVIAMVVIGSGISFIRTFFSQGQEALLETFPASDIGLNPTSDNPLVFSSNTVEVKQGETKVIQAAVYNSASSSVEASINSSGCVDKIGDEVTPGADTELNFVSPTSDIASGSSSGFQALVSTNGSAAANSPYICTLQAGESGSDPIASKQITIQVTQ